MLGGVLSNFDLVCIFFWTNWKKCAINKIAVPVGGGR